VGVAFWAQEPAADAFGFVWLPALALVNGPVLGPLVDAAVGAFSVDDDELVFFPGDAELVPERVELVPDDASVTGRPAAPTRDQYPDWVFWKNFPQVGFDGPYSSMP
jgi:hypothetical protein